MTVTSGFLCLRIGVILDLFDKNKALFCCDLSFRKLAHNKSKVSLLLKELGGQNVVVLFELFL